MLQFGPSKIVSETGSPWVDVWDWVALGGCLGLGRLGWMSGTGSPGWMFETGSLWMDD